MNSTTFDRSLLGTVFAKPERSHTDSSDVPVSYALRATVGLWCFVLLIFLPVIISRHGSDGWFSILLDSSTVIISMGIGMALFAVFRETVDWRPAARIAAWAAGIFAASLMQLAFDYLFTVWMAISLEASWAGMAQNLARFWGSWFNYLAVFSVNLGLFQIALGRRRVAAQERQLAEMRASAQQAEIAALRVQVNPHFLFNTLNAISSLIIARRNEAAEEAVDRLSAFLRSTADIGANESITIDEELSLVEQYMDIERIRFADRLQLDIDCSRAAGAREIPALLLMPVIAGMTERAVAATREPVTVAIAAEQRHNRLIVDIATVGPNLAIPVDLGPDHDFDAVATRLRVWYGNDAAISRQGTAGGMAVNISIAVR